MKNSILIIGVMMIFMVLISCSTRRKVVTHPIIIDDTRDYSKVIPDSTLVPGYNPHQRAFAYYLRSLGPEERNKWITNGSFSEQEKDNFLNKIDSLQMDIQLPDPPNSTIPDSLKK
jgi:hypothetical protein